MLTFLRTRLMHASNNSAISVFFLLTVFTVCAARAEVFGELSNELDGISLTYHYESGREYDVVFTEGTISYLRKDVPDREWEHDHPYVARKIEEGLFLLMWGREERTEHITILIDLNKRRLFTSALLDGVDRHFDEAAIIKLSQ